MLPTLSGVVSFEKSARRCDKKQVLASRRTAEVMDIYIVDALAHIFPVPAAIVAADDAPVLRNAKIDDSGLAAQAIDCVDGSGFERNRDIFPRTIFRAPDKQTFLSAGVDTNGSWSCHGYASLFYLRFETNNHRLETITK